MWKRFKKLFESKPVDPKSVFGNWENVDVVVHNPPYMSLDYRFYLMQQRRNGYGEMEAQEVYVGKSSDYSTLNRLRQRFGIKQ